MSQVVVAESEPLIDEKERSVWATLNVDTFEAIHVVVFG